MSAPKLKFSEIILLAIVNWKNFKGKVDRRSYWIAFIPIQLTLYALVFLLAASLSSNSFGLMLLSFLLLLTIIIISSSMTIRRLNDVNVSGSWYWISFTANAVCTLLSAYSKFSNQSPLLYQNLIATQIYLLMVSILSIALSIWILVKLSMPSNRDELSH